MLPRFGRALSLVSLFMVVMLAGCVASSGAANPAPQSTVGPKEIIPRVVPPKATDTPKPAIVVTAPVAGQTIRTPVRVTGSAQVFEGTVSIAVKDASGKVVGKGYTTASAGAPQRGQFSAEIAFAQPPTSQAGTVEVYSVSPKDGSVRDLVAIKVTLAGR